MFVCLFFVLFTGIIQKQFVNRFDMLSKSFATGISYQLGTRERVLNKTEHWLETQIRG